MPDESKTRNLALTHSLVLVVYSTGLTGLEPATSAVTGRCSNQLNYSPKREFVFRDNFYSASIIRVCQLHFQNLLKT